MAPGCAIPDIAYTTCTRMDNNGKRTGANIIKGSKVKIIYMIAKQLDKYTVEESLVILINKKLNVKHLKNYMISSKKCVHIFEHALNAKKNIIITKKKIMWSDSTRLTWLHNYSNSKNVY